MNRAKSFVHPQAIVETTGIGAGTRIWAFTHVMPGARIGRDCNIGEQCFIESGAVVGDSVVIKNGVSLWEGVTLGDRVFVGPNAVFTNDMAPRAKIFRHALPTRVEEGASIGANVTVRCGIEIGRWSLIGAGSVVTRSVPEFALVMGNPGRVRGYVCKCGERLEFSSRDCSECSCGMRFTLRGGGVAEISLEVLEPAGHRVSLTRELLRDCRNSTMANRGGEL
jgi:UDP-2-acetamido-3-amino-2,3-dideoxy-glucuronate N-acetyltransferase